MVFFRGELTFDVVFISILKEFSWNAIRMPSESFDCHSNAARRGLKCSRNVPIGPRMSADVIQNSAESHIRECIKNFHSDVILAHSASSVTRV